MKQNPADNSLDSIIEEFFSQLVIQHQYYSIKSKQPILLIGEKVLYEAIKETVGKANRLNNKTVETQNTRQFKPLPSFNSGKILP